MKSLAVFKRYLAVPGRINELFVTRIVEVRLGRLQRVRLSVPEVDVKNHVPVLLQYHLEFVRAAADPTLNRFSWKVDAMLLNY
jgi:hypothetical protein